MYKIMGGDQKEYGPVSSEKVREWITQGRANGQTMVSFESGPWKPLATFPEFADVLRTAVPPPLAQATYVGTTVKTSSLSISGLVCSILGICCFPLAIAGIICSIMGLTEINKNPQGYSTPRAIPIIGIIAGILFAIWGIASAIFFFTNGQWEEIMRRIPR
jgi:hypothetical protein